MAQDGELPYLKLSLAMVVIVQASLKVHKARPSPRSQFELGPSESLWVSCGSDLFPAVLIGLPLVEEFRTDDSARRCGRQTDRSSRLQAVNGARKLQIESGGGRALGARLLITPGRAVVY